MKTSNGLVEYCKKQLDVDTIYVLGTCGWNFTSALLNSKCNQLAWNAEHRSFLQQYVDQGKKAFDCCGLIKAYLWDEGYDAGSDEDEAMMYKRAIEKGSINAMPDIPGILVFMPGHVGVYVGNGEVIECTPNDAYGWGVQKHQLKWRESIGVSGWTSWAKYARIAYEGNPAPKPVKPTHGTGADQIIEVGSKVKLDGVFRIDYIDVARNLVASSVLSNGTPAEWNWIDATPLSKCNADGKNPDINGVFHIGDYFRCDNVCKVTEITYPIKSEPNGTCTFWLGNREVTCLCDRIYEVSNK